ncbi:MAG TPA: CPBP family intramembrane metalloprotease, partial [candidate division Zixibacteria bacterium]|nr:CPBP family intramembrane metalloprotease [candidate division Zixibacteria bacterium]
MPIGARRTPPFRWRPTHWSIGPFLLWLVGMATLFLVRILVKSPQEYASTVGFVIPLVNTTYIIWAVFATFQSGGKLSDLGITRRYGLLALALGLLVGFVIMGLRTLDPRFAGYLIFKMEVLPVAVVILAGGYHAFAEEVLFRGYFVGRLSRDFGWVPAVIISGIAYGLAPFAFLGADPLSTQQVAEIGQFFTTVFPAV